MKYECPKCGMIFRVVMDVTKEGVCRDTNGCRRRVEAGTFKPKSPVGGISGDSS